MPDLLACRWYAGTSDGGFTVVYAELPTAKDRPVGAFESWELADHAVRLHNASLEG